MSRSRDIRLDFRSQPLYRIGAVGRIGGLDPLIAYGQSIFGPELLVVSGDDGGVPVRGGEGDEDVGEVADVVFLEGVHKDGHGC